MKRLLAWILTLALLASMAALAEEIAVDAEIAEAEPAVAALTGEDMSEDAPIEALGLLAEADEGESPGDEDAPLANDSDVSVGPDSDPESIRYAQQLLVAVGALSAENVNGVYDSATVAAVAAFQAWVNAQRGELTLEVTGALNALTLDYLSYCYDRGLVIKKGVKIAADTFPDEGFRKYVFEECDADGDGTLSVEELSAVDEIYVPEMGISDLTGIEYFTELRFLGCWDNRLTALDLSRNAKLEYLSCMRNPIDRLDISNNPLLIEALNTQGPYKYDGALYVIPIKAHDDADAYLGVDETLVVTANGKTLYSPTTILKRTGPSGVIGAKEKCYLVDIIREGETYPYYISRLLSSACTFKSSNSKIAKVKADSSLVTGVKKGKANVTLTADGISVTCAVQVKKAPSKVTLSKSRLTLTVGDTKALKAKLPSGTASRQLTWTSSNEKVAVYNESWGAVEAVGPGTATIKVKTFNGKKASCKVTVKAPAPKTLELRVGTLKLHLKETYQLAPIIDEGTSTKFTYASKKKSIAKVSSKGVVTGQKKGTTKITVKTANGLKKTVTVVVGGKLEPVTRYKSGTSGIKVYATTSDAYFHTSASCVNLSGGSKITLETALNYGKTPCPVCAAAAAKKVYGVAGGTYYHNSKSHAGSKAKANTLAVALACGMEGCPDCVSNFYENR